MIQCRLASIHRRISGLGNPPRCSRPRCHAGSGRAEGGNVAECESSDVGESLLKPVVRCLGLLPTPSTAGLKISMGELPQAQRLGCLMR